MEFIFKYGWYAKILVIGYYKTILNMICGYICPALMVSEYLCSYVKCYVYVEDLYDIIHVTTNNADITNRFRVYCYMNDVIFVNELKLALYREFHDCDRLRIHVRKISTNEHIQFELDLTNNTIIGTSITLSQEQLLFDCLE